MEPSKYQKAVFDWFKTKPTQHLIVEAVAGSGKSWTINQALRLPEVATTSRRVVAFNKHIATALQEKVPMGVAVSTMHSFCLNDIIKREWAHPLKIKEDKVNNILQWDVMNFKTASPAERKDFYKAKPATLKVIGLLKAQAFTGDEPDLDLVEQLTNMHDIEMPELRHFDWWTVLGQVWRRGNAMTKVIDFDDMIYYPVLHKMEIPKSDYVFVDEAQDLNPVQIEVIAQMGHHIVAVGDRHQAIYGFRGADATAMDKLKDMLGDVAELPLSVCYRCPVAVIAEAQKIVPHIEAADNAMTGRVDMDKDYDPQPGEYVLCRTSAPLVKGCLALLSQGKAATVLGRDIAEGLTRLAKAIEAESVTKDIDGFLEAVEHHLSAELARLRKGNRDSEIMTLTDRVDALKAIAARCSTITGIYTAIEDIFADDAGGVVFMTIHKAKGLEAAVVYILRPDLLPHPNATQEWQQQQEANLKYVAITRATERLVYVPDSGTASNAGR